MANETEKAQEVYNLYRHDRSNGHDNFLTHAEEALRYYASDQWSEADRRVRRAQRRPTITINELFETINSIAGEMDQLSTDVRFQAQTGDEETADILNKLSAHTDRLNKMYVHDDRVRRDGLLTGRGFYEIRMDFEDNLQGNIKITSRRPQNVILPCDLEYADPATWTRVCTTEVLSLQDIEERYGKKRADDMRGMPIADWYDTEDRNLAQSLGYNNIYRDAVAGGLDSDNPYIRQYRQVSMQYMDYKQKDFFVDLETGDMSEIPETWSDERIGQVMSMYNLATTKRKAKTVRWRVIVNDRIVHDEDSPYKYYTIVPYLPFLTDGQTLSLFDVLRGPQDLLNKALSEELHIMTTLAHSGWKVKAGSLKNMTPRMLEQRGGENGLVMVLEDLNDAEKITANSPPAGFQDVSNRAQNWVKQLAGLTPSMQGNARADAAGEGIRMQLMRAPVNLAVPLTAFHFTKHLLAERKLDLYQTYYTDTRIMRVASGAYGQTEEIGINVPTEDGTILHNIAAGEYMLQIMPTGSRMQAEEYAFDELIKLKELGVNVPNDVLLAVSAIAAKADTIDRLREANSGDISPEEQRARELELENMELENEDRRAAVENKNALTQLSIARAQRAVADAQTPAARIALDTNRQYLEAQRDQNNVAMQREKHASDTALKLTELEVKRETEKEKAKAAAKKTVPKKQPRK